MANFGAALHKLMRLTSCSSNRRLGIGSAQGTNKMKMVQLHSSLLISISRQQTLTEDLEELTRAWALVNSKLPVPVITLPVMRNHKQELQQLLQWIKHLLGRMPRSKVEPLLRCPQVGALLFLLRCTVLNHPLHNSKCKLSVPCLLRHDPFARVASKN